MELRVERHELEEIGMGRAAMVGGSFLERRFRRGGSPAYYLSCTIDGESRHRYVRKGEVEYWRRRAEEWQRFISAMARLVVVNRQIEKELREIGKLRCGRLPVGRKK